MPRYLGPGGGESVDCPRIVNINVNNPWIATHARDHLHFY